MELGPAGVEIALGRNSQDQSFGLQHRCHKPPLTRPLPQRPPRDLSGSGRGLSLRWAVSDYLRLIAAILVIAHHARVLNGQPPLMLGPGLDPGALGVGIFFVISGFLVAGSQARDPRAAAFLAKRALRIFPGLLVAPDPDRLCSGPAGHQPPPPRLSERRPRPTATC
ncbi:acyltransferase family protein [Caulobacter segnis]